MNSTARFNISSTKGSSNLSGYGTEVIFVLLFSRAVTGNCLILLVWYRKFLPRKPLFFYAKSIAMAQLLFIANAILSTVMFQKGDWVYGNFVCKLWRILLESSIIASLMLLTAISRLHQRAFSSILLPPKLNRAKRFAYIIWTFSILVAAPNLSIYSVKTIGKRRQCVNDVHWSSEQLLIYLIFKIALLSFSAGYFIWSYGAIICIVKSFRVSPATIGEKARQAQKKSEKRKITILIGIMISFYLCLAPVLILKILQVVVVVDPNVFLVVELLAISCSSLTTFLLVFGSKEIKLAFRKLFSKILT